MKKENAIIAIIAAAVIGFLGGRMTSKPAAPSAPAAPEAVKVEEPKAPTAAKFPAVGPEDAKITIIEISDFQCPFCSRAAGTVDQLKKDYAKDLRLIFINQPLPFHDRAKPAAIAAQAADVNTVSGATQDSEAFNQSLAAALAQAKS